MIFTLAGHVDHGKTAIVKALTGVDTDRLKEEKLRGLTIDLGFAYLDLGEHRVGFVDVPGHHRFIHNMIAGVARMQHALLVIAADDGVMPQTREHVQILGLLGVRDGTVVLNKVDRVDEEHMALVRDDVRGFLDTTFLAGSPVVEVSAVTGVGIPALRDRLIDVTSRWKSAHVRGRFRLAVDRAFTVRGSGTVVTGTVIDGTISRGDSVSVSGRNQQHRIRSIDVQGRESNQATLGDRTGLNLVGIDTSEVARGDWIISPDAKQLTSFLGVRLQILDDFPRRVRPWSPVHVYHQTSHCQARLDCLDRTEARPGSTTLADLALENQMHFKVGDALVVRDHDLQRTLGGGVVVSLDPRPRRRRTPERVQQLTMVSDYVVRDDPAAELKERTQDLVLDLTEYLQQHNLDEDWLNECGVVKDLQVNGRLATSKSRAQSLRSEVLRLLRQYHHHHPESPGPSVEDLLSASELTRIDCEFALSRALEAREAKLTGGAYYLPDHVSTAVAYDEELFAVVRNYVSVDQPLSIGDIAKRTHRRFDALQREIQRMVRAQLFVQVSPNRIFTPERIRELAELAIAMSAAEPFTVRDFRDRSGVSRNVTIELLEYFDQSRFTQRKDDTRVVVGELDSLL